MVMISRWGTGRTKRDPAIFFQTQQQYAAGEKAGLVNPYGWFNEEYESLVAQAELNSILKKSRNLSTRK